jgi:hypothetical protein
MADLHAKLSLRRKVRTVSFCVDLFQVSTVECSTYRISRRIRRTTIFSLGILEKKKDECILM